MPGQRSGFHICDILDLNNSDPKISGSNNSSNVDGTDTNPTTLSTNSTTISSRDEPQNFAARHGFLSSGPASAYQLPPNINSAMLGESVGQYHPMFPAAAKAWFQEQEHYGKLLIVKKFILAFIDYSFIYYL